MQTFEYTVIPAPVRGEKAKGARTGVERFSYALLIEMNRMAANGWEYVRAETLPCEERSGLTSRTTVYHNVLVFRRALHSEQPRNTLPAGRHEPIHAVMPGAPALQAAHAAPVRHPAPASAPPLPATPIPAERAEAAAPARQPDPPPSWPDGPSGDATPTGQPVFDRTPVQTPDRTPDPTHVPERVSDDTSDLDAYPLVIDDEPAGSAPFRPAFGEAMPRRDDADLPADPAAPPTRLGPAQR